jgi:hypothetical protein
VQLGPPGRDCLLELRFDLVDGAFGVPVADHLEPPISLLGRRLSGDPEITQDHQQHQAAAQQH